MTESSAVPRAAHGFGLATIAVVPGSNGADEATVLDVWFPAPALGAAAEHLSDESVVDAAPAELVAAAESGDDADRGAQLKVVFTQIDLNQPPADTADAYLRLHLLAH